jgi:hypothetical protein
MYKNILYIANKNEGPDVRGFISQVDLETGLITIPPWGQDPDNIQNPTALVVYKNILYIANVDGGFISQVDLCVENPVVKRPSWGSDPNIQEPFGLAVSGNFLYIAIYRNDPLLQVDLIQGAIVSSFPLSFFTNFVTTNGNQLYVSGINYETGVNTIARMNLLPPLTFP